jgi:hypothetical protein
VSSGRAAAGQWPSASMGRAAVQRAQAGDGSRGRGHSDLGPGRASVDCAAAGRAQAGGSGLGRGCGGFG